MMLFKNNRGVKHSSTSKKVKLRENPNKEDKRDSYRVIGYQEDTKDNFGKKITKWRINPLDDEDIRKDKKR